MKKVSIDEFSDILKAKVEQIKSKVPVQLGLCCEVIRSTAVEDMKNTPRNPDITYYSGKNGNIEHHPSLPGNPPAPDSGNLRESIHYTVDADSGEIPFARVGTDVEYGKHLEFGTTNILPRPWLKPAIEKNINKIRKLMRGVLK